MIAVRMCSGDIQRRSTKRDTFFNAKRRRVEENTADVNLSGRILQRIHFIQMVIGHFQHPTWIDDTITWFQIAMTTNRRIAQVSHSLDESMFQRITDGDRLTRTRSFNIDHLKFQSNLISSFFKMSWSGGREKTVRSMGEDLSSWVYFETSTLSIFENQCGCIWIDEQADEGVHVLVSKIFQLSQFSHHFRAQR